MEREQIELKECLKTIILKKREIDNLYIRIEELKELNQYKAVELASKPDELQEQILTEIRRMQRSLRDAGKNMNYNLCIKDNEIKFEMSIQFGFDVLFDEERKFNACDFKTNIESLQRFISKIDIHRYISL